LAKRNQKTPDAPAAKLFVKVQPGASRNAIVGKSGEEWKLAVTAPPVEGRANEACIDLVAKRLGIPRSAVRIARGQSGRKKILEIEGLPIAEIEQRLGEVGGT
jgi:uncharacterized protein (TIGR00251 family)